MTGIFAAAKDPGLRTYSVPRSGETYGVTVSVMAPEAFTGGVVEVVISDAQGTLASKTLHSQDLDFYASVKVRRAGELSVRLNAPKVLLDAAKVRVNFASLSLADPRVVSAQPNRDWQSAQPMEVGRTVFGSADERPYVPVSPEKTYAALTTGYQWFRFTTRETRLVYFSVDTPDRDVPPDVDVFTLNDGVLEPYGEGASAYNPEATQNFPGLSKFRSRIVKPGFTYYVRVAANHPAFRLHSSVYDVPDHKNSEVAVRTGMDFLVNLGDAWHANTPRRGAIALRNTMGHAEPQSCIACHPTQFTTRAYLTAVRNGYPDTQHDKLDFLLTRIENNPRPLYGQPGANWARVIYSARTVASRVPVLLDLAGLGRLSGAQPDVTRGYANFLALHDEGRTDLAGDEADGCSPNVSPFEIALQTWQTYGLMARDFPGEARWVAKQREIARAMEAKAPANVIDLAWKIAAHAAMGGSSPDPLIEELYRWQRADGRFPMLFDGTSQPADFITFQAMYALALAGRKPETDAKLARMVTYALSVQRPDGSWQGDPIYKGFNTPFRDTQFAVMALSQIYPQRANQTAAAVTVRLRTEHLDELLADIEAFHGETSQLRRVLAESNWTLAREAAAAALGNLNDRQAIPMLVQALGDGSKLVQRAAAQSLRRLEVSGPQSDPAPILAALKSADARTRWGALRIFHQEFRRLADRPDLLKALQGALQDAVPQNRFQAADALWHWYMWQRNDGILDSLAARMGQETDANVRRGLTESIYNVLDENVGQLAAWQRTMARDADRAKTEAALHEAVRRQSEVVARRLESGNRSARLGILTALWDFHLRHMAIPEDNRQKVDVILPAFYSNYSAGVHALHEAGFEYGPYRETARFRYDARNGFQIVRLGNDGELFHLYADSGSALENALLACLKDADPEMTLEVIKAGSVLQEAVTPKFTAAMMEILAGKNEELSAAVRYVYEQGRRGKLTLGPADQPDAQVLLLTKHLSFSAQEDALAVVLPLLAGLPAGSVFTRDAALTGAMEALLRDSRLPSFAWVIRAAAQLPGTADSPILRAQMLDVLKSGNEQAGLAAVDLVLSRYLTDARVDALTHQFLAAMQGRLRAMFLDQLDPAKYSLKVTAANSYRTGADAPLPVDDNLFSSTLVVSTVAESLAGNDAIAREAARDLVAQQERLRSKPEIQLIVNHVLARQAVKNEPATPTRTAPDYAFFAERIQPILQKPGADGKACVMCHASHAVFRLTDKQTRENYQHALKVIDTAEPRRSLLLIKPTKPNDSVADPTLYLGSHNGGERWQGNEASPEYQTILEWIRGAKAFPKPSAYSAGPAGGPSASQ